MSGCGLSKFYHSYVINSASVGAGDGGCDARSQLQQEMTHGGWPRPQALHCCSGDLAPLRATRLTRTEQVNLKSFIYCLEESAYRVLRPGVKATGCVA